MIICLYIIASILGIIISYYQIVSLLEGSIVLGDILNVLYLNFETYPKYEIETSGLQNIIVFMLIVILLYSYTTKDRREINSFYLMMIHRRASFSSYYRIVKYQLLNSVKLYVVTISMFSVLNIFINRELSWLFFIYFFRLNSIILSLGLFCDSLGFRMNQNLIISQLPYVIICLLLIIEKYSNIFIFAYSNDLYIEILRAGVSIICACASFFVSGTIMKRGAYNDSI